MVRKSLDSRAQKTAKESLGVMELPRKVIVYVEPTYWARYWFKEYVKPVFDAGALDYELFEPETADKLSFQVRERLWAAQLERQAIQERAEREARQKAAFYKSWFGYLHSWVFSDAALYAFYRVVDESVLIPSPLFLAPKYSPETGIIAIGPLVWRHVLLGITEGSLSLPPAEPSIQPNPNDWTQESPLLPLPPLGFITGKNQSGWVGFPSRVLGYFTSRYIASQIGEEALGIVFNLTRPFKSGDELNGTSDLAPLPELKGEVSQEDQEYHSRAVMAQGYDKLDERVLELLKVYRPVDSIDSVDPVDPVDLKAL